MAVKVEGTQDAQHIMTGISHMIAFLICFILLLWLYFQIRVKEEKIGNTKLLIYTVLGIGLNGLTSLSVVIVGFTTKNQQQNNSLAIISANIFRGAEVFVWLVFIKRLKISFSNTKYQSSNAVYYTFYFLIFIFIVSNAIYTLMYILYQELHIVDMNAYDIDAEINLWLEQIIDLMMTTGLLYLYSNKLYRLNKEIGMRDPSQLKEIQRYSMQKAKSQQKDDSNEKSLSNNDFERSVKATISMNGDYEYQRDVDDDDNDDMNALRLTISFNKGQQKILRVMSRISTLSFLAIIFVQFIALYLATMESLIANNIITEQQYYFWQGWLIFIWSFGVMINAICMFLSFDFVSKYYYKWCRICDKCCFNCCKHIVGWRIRNHVIKQTELGAPLLIREGSELL